MSSTGTLYYAIGGGYGHATRAAAVINTLQLPGPVHVLVSPHVVLPESYFPQNTTLLRLPAQLADNNPDVASWINRRIDELGPATLVVDTFPTGILTELSAALERRPPEQNILVSRRLAWPAFIKANPGYALPPEPRFNQGYAVEPLAGEDLQHLGHWLTEPPQPLDLRDPSPSADPDRDALEFLTNYRAPVWLVAHAGPPSEVRELVDDATRTASAAPQPPATVLLACPCSSLPPELPGIVTPVSRFPVWPLFPHVDTVLTGGGCNAVRQARRLAKHHLAIPFPRRFDDQQKRIGTPGTLPNTPT